MSPFALINTLGDLPPLPGVQKDKEMKTTLVSELEDSYVAFYSLLDSLSDEDLQKESRNPPWSNKQIVFHMVFGFFLLPSLIVIVLIFGRLPRKFSGLFATLLNLGVRPFN